VLHRAFTLKELARGVALIGPGDADETLPSWLQRLEAHRSLHSLVGAGHDEEMDVADPVGLGPEAYERTADLLDELLLRVLHGILLVPLPQEQAT
jgi:hypothetical protein